MASETALFAAAQRIAPSWIDDVATVELISISENAVYRVATHGGEQLVLRLHRPGYNSADEMAAEARWVLALAESGVEVAAPVQARDGRFHVPVEVEGEEPRLVGAVEWVDGTPLGQLLVRDPSRLEEAFRAAGVLAAQLRRHAQTWHLPEGFERRSWNADGLLGANPLWGRFWEAPVLTAPDREIVLTARDQVRAVMSSLSLELPDYGLIHADLHVNNILAADDRYVAIDFDDAGFGWFVWEIAVAFQSLGHHDPPERFIRAGRGAFVDGYRSIHPLSDAELEVVDALCVARDLNIIGWMWERPEVVPTSTLEAFAAAALQRTKRWMEQ